MKPEGRGTREDDDEGGGEEAAVRRMRFFMGYHTFPIAGLFRQGRRSIEGAVQVIFF